MHEHWSVAYADLNDELRPFNESGEPLTSAMQRKVDLYNQLNSLNVAMQHRLAEVERQEAERLKFADQASIAKEFDERTYWFRRFHTSLAIAHGGAFAAVASKLFDPAATQQLAVAAWYPLALFATGMVIAGALPLALHRRNESLGWRLAVVSACVFVLGLAATLFAIWQKGELFLPF